MLLGAAAIALLATSGEGTESNSGARNLNSYDYVLCEDESTLYWRLADGSEETHHPVSGVRIELDNYHYGKEKDDWFVITDPDKGERWYRLSTIKRKDRTKEEGGTLLANMMKCAGDEVEAATEAYRSLTSEQKEKIAEVQARQAYLNEPHSMMFIASMSDSIQLDTETGLIKQDTFRLKWNNLETVPEWAHGVRNQYIAIKKGEVTGSVAIIKNNIYLPPADNYKSFNIYGDLNTGQFQKPPTLTRLPGREVPTFRISYGDRGDRAGESAALKRKYQRFEGNSTRAMVVAIDGIVDAAIKGIRAPSKYTFKKIDSNTRFKRENLSLLGGSSTVPENIEVSTTSVARISPMTTGPAGGSSY
jgi:hypothetical protein